MEKFDTIVIGGGITGAAVARDAAMRGLTTLLIEKSEPGRATTASSTHLLHGGLRYLLYDLKTAQESAWDCGHILRIARPLFQRQFFLWPVYRHHRHGMETVETLLEVYDRWQGLKEGLPHRRFSVRQALEHLPSLKSQGLLGALRFDEWWMDPVRLVEETLASAQRYGARIQTRTQVRKLLKSGNLIEGVETESAIGPQRFGCRILLNTTGPWTQEICRMAGIALPMSLRKGIHLVYPGTLTPTAVLLEAIDRKRYIFVVPLNQKTLLGPTDDPWEGSPDSLKAEPHEIEYLLQSAQRSFQDFPTQFSSTTAGARPILFQPASPNLLSRDHAVLDHEILHGISGLLTLAGGKLSTHRKMAQDAVNLALKKLGKNLPCRTHLETLEGLPLPESERLKRYAHRFPPATSLPGRIQTLQKRFRALLVLGAFACRHWMRRLKI
ncbi:MAG: glycerol-3-phosphate dehydrogenase/oxidase [Elusimicrobia bacterium]|nr:glycerol-3-phosphate dehydrogenase/oxidase [Elusimicrobiota bacterium]